MEEMSDTPRTDKAEGCRGFDDSWIKMVNGGNTTADFARERERENIKLREALERFRDLSGMTGYECTDTAEDCLDSL